MGGLELWAATRLRGVAFVLILALAGPLTGCKIVQISDSTAQAEAGFDAAAYASDMWVQRVLPYFAESSRAAEEVVPAIVGDLETAGASFGYTSGEGSPWLFIVEGAGIVTAKNIESRAGTLVVAIAGANTEISLQIGPVIRGNAIRDALPFVSFQDFTNQIEFADAGKALTALAYEAIAPAVEGIAVGDTVTFTGSISMASASDRMLITPVTLEKAAP